MSAADVSGVLALMQDYFTNTLRVTPSPALLKAMLINGARPTGNYYFGLQNAINYEGWGLINLTNSLPPGITIRTECGRRIHADDRPKPDQRAGHGRQPHVFGQH